MTDSILIETVHNQSAKFRRKQVRQINLSVVSLLLVAAMLQGCASTPKRNPLPQALYPESRIPGIEDARYWGDEPSPFSVKVEAADVDSLQDMFPAVFGKPFHVLAISGGGENGAFGAGLLAGWTESGTRPEFSVVTGISTGALAAPFAFLGSEYDHVLREVYTTTTTDDIVKRRGKLKTIQSDAAGDSAPLSALISEHVDETVMAEIAREHRRGRHLLVGTTNIDALRPVTWDIGEIAASGRSGALDLIRDILLASASIPIAFPPVTIEVESAGQFYDEMHVDGGVTRQTFLFTFGVHAEELLDLFEVVGEPEAYVIRNAKLSPTWKTVDRKIMAIAGRSIESMTRTQGIGDLYREYLGAERFGFDYNLAYIPDDFSVAQEEFFDPAYMSALFTVGFDLAKDGYPWHKAPPGLEEE